MNQLKGATEENVITLLCFSEEHGPYVAAKVPPEYYGHPDFQKLARAAAKHIKQYKKPPGIHTYDHLEPDIRRDDGERLKDTLDKMRQLAPLLQPAFVLDELNQFLHVRALGTTLEAALRALSNGDLSQAHGIMRSAPHLAVSEGTGILFSDPDQSLRWMEQREEDFFSTGVETLDAKGVRPSRKSMFLFIAPPGSGKSWWAVEMGKQNVMRRRTVVHITLEMPEDQVAQRYIQNFWALRMREGGRGVTASIDKDENDRGVSISFSVSSRAKVDTAMRRELAARIKGLRYRPALKIKEFPSGSLTVAQLDNYLDVIAAEEKIYPDLLIIDYPDLMRLDSRNLRTDTGNTFREIRGIAMRRNLAVFCPTQGGRRTKGARIVRMTDVAEDFSKCGTADTVVCYQQTEEESHLNLARLWVDKARGARDKFEVAVVQNYETGQFCIDSVIKDTNYEKAFEDAKRQYANAAD